jgi:hypothetical protein
MGCARDRGKPPRDAVVPPPFERTQQCPLFEPPEFFTPAGPTNTL